MRKTLLAALGFLALATLGVADVLAQVPGFPQTLPPNTVVGRRGAATSGPSQAIPFATLATDFATLGVFRTKVTDDNTIFWVSLSGSDANSCATSTAPCATFVGAYAKAQQGYDFAGHPVNFVFKDVGTYTGNSGIRIDGTLVGVTTINISGNGPSPSSFIIQPTSTCTTACQPYYASNITNIIGVSRLTLNSSSVSVEASATLGDGTFTFFTNIIWADTSASGIDIQPAFTSKINIVNPTQIVKTQNLKTATFASAATTITVNNNTGIQIGDVVTQVTNAAAPVGAAIYTRIQPFTRVSNIAGTTITIDAATIATDGGAAKNVLFTRPSSYFIQADQRAEVFFVGGGDFTITGVAGYTAAFMSADLATNLVATSSAVNWKSDSGTFAQVNGVPFAIQSGATIDTGTDAGSGPDLCSVPGVCLTMTGTVTQNATTVVLSTTDFDRVNRYATKFMGASGYRGLMVSDAEGRIVPGTVIPAAGNLSTPNFVMSRAAIGSSGTSNLKIAGFAWNHAINLGTQNAPPILGSASSADIPVGSAIATLNSPQTFTALETFSGGIALTGVITPPQITSDQNNYAPTGCASASLIRLSSDATRTITGLGCGGSNLLILQNVGANSIVLSNQNASSTAGNRFLFGADITLKADTALTITYDSTSQRFRTISPPFKFPLPVDSGGTGAATLTNHGVLLGQGTSAVVATAAPTTGQLLGGVTGADPAFSSSPTVTTQITPVSNGGANLGTASLQWANLFLASGGLVDFGNANYRIAHSADTLSFQGTSAATNFQITTTASSVNQMSVTGAGAGNFPAFTAVGSDTNIGFFFRSKGTGTIQFLSENGARNAFLITPAATATNYGQLQTAATGNPVTFNAVGSDTNINLNVQGQGTGIVRLGQTICTVTGATPQTCNGQRSIVTTGTLTTAAVTAATYVINNSSVATTSLVHCNIQDYSGTWVTNGMPIIGEQVPGAGTITLQIVNTHATNALNGTLAIGCVVFN